MSFFYTTSPIAFYSDAAGTPPAGAVAISDDDYKALFAGQGAGRSIKLDSTGKALTLGPAPTAPFVPTALAVAAGAALMAGLTVTCTSVPAINGTYSCSLDDLQHIQSEILSIVVNTTFADGTTTLDWLDTSGAVHTFPSIKVFKEFALAMNKFVAQCSKAKLGTIKAVPSASVTIA